MKFLFSHLLALSTGLALLTAAAPTPAATLTWPGTSFCATTLQACIDGSSNGDRVEIATNTTINESLFIDQRSVEVVAANGYRPQIVSGQSISISSTTATGDQTVLIDGLRLRSGAIFANYSGVGVANYTIRNAVIEGASVGNTGNFFSRVSGGTLNLTLYNNEIHCSADFVQSSVVRIESDAATTLNANVFNNKVSCQPRTGIVRNLLRVNIGSSFAGVAEASLKIHANEFRVDRTDDPSGTVRGVEITEVPNAATPSFITTRVYNNVVIGNGRVDVSNNDGISALVNRGDMALQILNNTVVGWDRSIYVGSYNAAGSGSQNIDGTILNNVLVSRSYGFFLQPTTTSGLTNDYNLVNTSSIGTTLGSHSITAPARLVSTFMPRLLDDSPAIDAGEGLSLLVGLAAAGLPPTDADGLRRFIGDGSKPDMGAYESGDATFEQRATASGSATTIIDSPALDGMTTPIPQASVRYVPGSGINYYRAFGFYQFGGTWAIIDEANIAFPVGTTFNVFVPGSGSGVFRHVATSALTSNYYTRLDNSSLQNRPDLIVLATQSRVPSLVFNPHPISVYTDAANWFVDNTDRVDMPINADFDIYWQEPSPNAFRIRASTANTNFQGLRVNHPLLDGKPCARPQASRLTPNTGVVNDGWQWFYAGGWYLTSPAGIPIGTQFNVLVDPAQVAACSDVIFADGFESTP